MIKNKLWEKETYTVPDWLIDFTVGKDRLHDLQLAEFDVIGSIAHAGMLYEVELISKDEFNALQKYLLSILKKIKENDFIIEKGVEDVHSQIEKILTKELGDIGKKIHTGRSRNDQVLTDIKLFIKHNLSETTVLVKNLFDLLQQKSEQYKDALLPGYTHLQAAMPSSFGLWFGAYAESLSDDLELMVAAFNIANKNSLGSGAGYGSSLPLKRILTTKAMGFSDMNYNSVYAQMTRGKTEKACVTALAGIAATLSKFAMDVCLYNSQNFGFVSFPAQLTTGSSIMPHKKNPDVFELIRAKCNRIQAIPNELSLLLTNLPSGYHRDLQLTKEMVFPAFETINACINACINMLKEIIINKDAINETKYELLFSVEEVNKLVKAGIPFREAYMQVADTIENKAFKSNGILHHTHEGSIGNLCTAEIKKGFEASFNKIVK